MTEELASLAAHPYHVAPGDILLLRGAGKGWHNRAGQVAKRGRSAMFTHVAVLVDGTLVADAMPDHGVRFRPWHDLETACDIGLSRVARHRALAADPDGHGRVHRSALFFFEQPYRLSTALVDAGRIADQSGLVCSHFVAAVFEKLGIQASNRPATATLPVDLDRFTSASADWWQFPLSASGLCSGAVPPPQGDPYWQAASGRLVPVRQSGGRVASGPTRAETRGAALSRAEALLSQHDPQAMAADMARLVADTAARQHEISRMVVAWDRSMLHLNQALAAGHPAAQRIAARLLSSRADEQDKLRAVTGAVLAERLEALYATAAPPELFLHAAEDAAQRRAGHQKLLNQQAHQLRDQAAGLVSLQGGLADTITRLAGVLATLPDPRQAITGLVDAAQALLDAGSFLCTEPREVIAQRLADIDARGALLMGWLEAGEIPPDEAALAVETFNAMAAYDADAELWQRLYAPQLHDSLLRLRGLLAGPGH